MKVKEILAVKGSCEFVLSELEIAKWLRDSGDVQEIWKRLSPRRADPGFLTWYGKMLKERAEYYKDREFTGNMAYDNPIDVEKFYMYLLVHEVIRQKLHFMFAELHEAMEKTQGVMERTFEWRRKTYLEAQQDKKSGEEEGLVCQKNSRRGRQAEPLSRDVDQEKGAPMKSIQHPYWFQSVRRFENVLEINRLWSIPCFGFVVDPRFLMIDDMEHRLGISFGPNETSPRTGFLAPPAQTGRYVFGVHNVVVVEREINLVDRWFTSIQCEEFDDLSEALIAAQHELASIDDEEYQDSCTFHGTVGRFGRSDLFMLEQFTISTKIG